MNLSQLTESDIERLDPYAFMAVLGKRVIHPGGRRSTREMFELAGFQASQRVLDVGCGVATTAIEIARRFGCHVTAVDVDSLMLDRATANVRGSGVANVGVARADIQALEFPDAAFDRVVIEAVTMFVDRPRAAREVVRVCRHGGRVLDHEFIYRRPPPAEVRRIFEGQVCPGIHFDTADDWLALYRTAGLSKLEHTTGPFSMMTPLGMVRDEGVKNVVAMMSRIALRRAYRRKMIWLMSRMLRVMKYLGYVVLVGTKPSDASWTRRLTRA
ncbi:MAG TPA: class I SAM-dependent methyltransferase [Gemmatimonadales bacterium]|nr:class I SAM-dependent methyltransferase [Gemmatimonadales bacterium]